MNDKVYQSNLFVLLVKLVGKIYFVLFFFSSFSFEIAWKQKCSMCFGITDMMLSQIHPSLTGEMINIFSFFFWMLLLCLVLPSIQLLSRSITTVSFAYSKICKWLAFSRCDWCRVLAAGKFATNRKNNMPYCNTVNEWMNKTEIKKTTVAGLN